MGQSNKINRNYAWLPELGKIMGNGALWLIADSPEPEQNRAWLERCRAIGAASLTWVVGAGMENATKLSQKQNGVELLILPEWPPGADFPAAALEQSLREHPDTRQNPPCRKFIMSTTPYDSYGVYVKLWEFKLVSLLKTTGATYCIHDQHYGLVRLADAQALHERCHTRKKRLYVYKTAVRLALWAAGYTLPEKHGWQSIK
jgi:hypothetical protein